MEDLLKRVPQLGSGDMRKSRVNHYIFMLMDLLEARPALEHFTYPMIKLHLGPLHPLTRVLPLDPEEMPKLATTSGTVAIIAQWRLDHGI